MFKAEHQQEELFHQLQQLRVHQTGSVQPQTAAVQGHDMVNINIYSMIEILLIVENVYKVLIVRIWRSVVHISFQSIIEAIDSQKDLLELKTRELKHHINKKTDKTSPIQVYNTIDNYLIFN